MVQANDANMFARLWARGRHAVSRKYKDGMNGLGRCATNRCVFILVWYTKGEAAARRQANGLLPTANSRPAEEFDGR